MSDNRTPSKMPFRQSLFLGLYGDQVVLMKMWLNELNDYYKFSRKVKIEESNYFGFDAVHFIRDFQRFCNLPTTGAYDAKTHEMVEWKYFNMEDNFRIESKIALAKSPKAVSDAAERQRIDRIMGTSRKWK